MSELFRVRCVAASNSDGRQHIKTTATRTTAQDQLEYYLKPENAK